MTARRHFARLALVGMVVLAGGWVVPAAASCTLTLRVENEGSYGVRIPLAEAQVRASVDPSPGIRVWGPWRSAQAGGWFASATHRVLEPGASIDDTYIAEQPCLLRREFRVIFRCLGGPRQGQTQSSTGELRARLSGGTGVAWVGSWCNGS